MIILPILFLGAGFATCVYSNVISAEGDENLCPPPENIAPCTCFKAPITQRLTAWCTNFENAGDIQAIFDRNPLWNLQDVWIDHSVMHYLPAIMLEKARFQSLNLTSNTLVTLFDKTPVTTPELNLYMTDVRLNSDFKWESIANANLLELGTTNMRIKSFGQRFKDNIPKGVQRIWFENTGVRSIKYQAFSVLKKLEILVLKGGNLKNVSRDMFPNPWIVNFLDLSNQKIADLPEDFFTGMPNLSFFLFQENMLTTLSEKVFTKHQIFYAFKGNPINCNCNIKWVIGNIRPAYLTGECAEPKSLKGTNLGDLKAESFRYCQ